MLVFDWLNICDTEPIRGSTLNHDRHYKISAFGFSPHCCDLTFTRHNWRLWTWCSDLQSSSQWCSSSCEQKHDQRSLWKLVRKFEYLKFNLLKKIGKAKHCFVCKFAPVTPIWWIKVSNKIWQKFMLFIQCSTSKGDACFDFLNFLPEANVEKINWNMNNWDAPEGSVNCGKDAVRLGVPGIDQVENSIVETLSGSKIGEKIFKFKTFIPRSCIRYEFENVIIKPTVSGNTGIESFSANSAYSLAKEHGQEVSASVAVKYMAVSASVGASHSETHGMEVSHSASESWTLERVRTVETEVSILTQNKHFPRLHPEFQRIIEDKCDGPLKNITGKMKKLQKEKDERPQLLRKKLRALNKKTKKGKISLKTSAKLNRELKSNFTRDDKLSNQTLAALQKSLEKAEFQCGRELHTGRSLIVVDAEIGARANKVSFQWFAKIPLHLSRLWLSCKLLHDVGFSFVTSKAFSHFRCNQRLCPSCFKAILFFCCVMRLK